MIQWAYIAESKVIYYSEKKISNVRIVHKWTRKQSHRPWCQKPKQQQQQQQNISFMSILLSDT